MPGPAFIEGETVDLRTIEEEDIAFMQTVVNDREIWRAIGRPAPVNRAQEREFYEEVVSGDEQLTLMIVAEDQPVGMVSLTPDGQTNHSAELGYWIAPDHQRQGYGSAGVSHVLTHGFDQQGYHRIAARVFAFNEASQGLLESLGFTLEGRHREAAFVDGEYTDVLWYGLLAAEWEPGDSP